MNLLLRLGLCAVGDLDHARLLFDDLAKQELATPERLVEEALARSILALDVQDVENLVWEGGIGGESAASPEEALGSGLWTYSMGVGQSLRFPLRRCWRGF